MPQEREKIIGVFGSPDQVRHPRSTIPEGRLIYLGPVSQADEALLDLLAKSGLYDGLAVLTTYVSTLELN